QYSSDDAERVGLRASAAGCQPREEARHRVLVSWDVVDDERRGQGMLTALGRHDRESRHGCLPLFGSRRIETPANERAHRLLLARRARLDGPVPWAGEVVREGGGGVKESGPPGGAPGTCPTPVVHT